MMTVCSQRTATGLTLALSILSLATPAALAGGHHRAGVAVGIASPVVVGTAAPATVVTAVPAVAAAPVMAVPLVPRHKFGHHLGHKYGTAGVGTTLSVAPAAVQYVTLPQAQAATTLTVGNLQATSLGCLPSSNLFLMSTGTVGAGGTPGVDPSKFGSDEDVQLLSDPSTLRLVQLLGGDVNRVKDLKAHLRDEVRAQLKKGNLSATDWKDFLWGAAVTFLKTRYGLDITVFVEAAVLVKKIVLDVLQESNLIIPSPSPAPAPTPTPTPTPTPSPVGPFQGTINIQGTLTGTLQINGGGPTPSPTPLPNPTPTPGPVPPNPAPNPNPTNPVQPDPDVTPSPPPSEAARKARGGAPRPADAEPRTTPVSPTPQ